MEEQPFAYDVHLYDRRFLNCFQRHAVVFMKRLGIEVDWLFYNALPAVDDIFQQMVVQNKAKYALQSGYFADDDLALLGVRFHERKAEHLDELLPVIHQQIQAYGCAFLSGDVYYFAHCPNTAGHMPSTLSCCARPMPTAPGTSSMTMPPVCCANTATPRK